MTRPPRLRIPNELGQLRTLPDDVAPDGVAADGMLPGTFDVLPPRGRDGDAPAEVVVLGVGPNPVTTRRAVSAALAGLRPGAVPTGGRTDLPVRFVECPAFFHYIDAASSGTWRAGIPAGWTQAAPDDFSPPRLARALVVVYREAERLFPTFWGPLLGAARAVRMAPTLALRPEDTMAHAEPSSPPHRTVLLPGTEGSLLLPELEAALAAEGLTPRRVNPDTLQADLSHLLADQRPALFLSVNLQGLDAWGERFHLLRACGVPVAVWCVDNPFHLLSALRGPWWRAALLCVTDASFIPLLHAHGAQQVMHLPLATGPEFFGPEPHEGDLPASGRPGKDGAAGSALSSTASQSATLDLKPVVFVGRSAFPGKGGFFAGQRIAPALLDEARGLLAAPGPRPDFHWWTARLGIDRLWPGNAVRAAGLGAEECALARRVRCLNAAAPRGLTVFGDDGWRPLLPPGAEVRPPVDYYATLPAVYRAARWSLNVTSLLLPAGLTQRHFDVWAAGGFCITDDTPGLDIFPPELRREIAFSPARSGGENTTSPPKTDDAPSLGALLDRLERDPTLRGDLAAAWRAHILSGHTYRHRVRALCAALGLE
ncbi:glycosyltransferase [Nitratidesulfovibrio sp. HK-II]|uniref:glycosyltransferase family protein n=1 Tax=Nitratidesulfovibrio sp. HK-II TaxID=2009266 RepID=UPI000E2F86E8|nr:glycosyltransferase [Nitratidesulfovibrio sp. HK-II]GBO96373.1 CgeB family protein [Nitratidesulfovibrio sp. HK-II]